jgi:hypothetical protein
MTTRRIRVAADDGGGFGPSDQDSAEEGEADEGAEDDDRGHDEGADRIDVVDGIECDASLKPRGLIAETRRHPGMGTLMDAQREDEQNKLEDCDCKFSRLHQTLPGFGKLRLAWCAVPPFHCG